MARGPSRYGKSRKREKREGERKSETEKNPSRDCALFVSDDLFSTSSSSTSLSLSLFTSKNQQQNQQKQKQLRLNKVSELIHSSTRHRDNDTARVSVHFKEIVDTGEHSYDEVPGSDLVVSRTAHRNNSSHYFVDGKKSSYGEVTTLLKAKGVDLATGRFLILQGEVEQIALMKPKGATQHETGLLEYLEDVIGTDRYVEAIDAGARELEGLNDARASALARSRAAARERDGAAGAAEEARGGAT